jgi:hypothetical protein
MQASVSRIRVRAFLIAGSGSGIGKKSRSGSGMNISDHIAESLETIFWVKILKFSDPDPGYEIFLTLDPGWKNFGSGLEKNRIRDMSDCACLKSGRNPPRSSEWG